MKTKLLALLFPLLLLAGHLRADEELPVYAQWLAAPAQTRGEIAADILAQTRQELDVISRLATCETEILLGQYPPGAFYWILNGTLENQIGRVRTLLHQFRTAIEDADRHAQMALTLHQMYLADAAAAPPEYRDTVTMVYLQPILGVTHAAAAANDWAWVCLQQATEALQALEAALN